MTTALAVTMVSAPTVSHAKGAKLTRDQYQERSLKNLSFKGGVKPAEFQSFFEAMRSSPRPSPNFRTDTCAKHLEVGSVDRSAFLNCLKPYGRRALSPSLLKNLFEIRAETLRQAPTLKRHQTLALMGYVQDLAKESLRDQGENAVWVTKEGVTDFENKMDFDFQDGDVVLGMGNSSISSLISQTNKTPTRYSHAFIVRKRDGKMTTVESLIQTGVKAFPLQHFIDDPYNQLTVLRWKNEAQRKKFAAIASDWAQAAADRKAPYDMPMDFDEDYKIYCSELIVKAYAEASGIDPKKILPHFSKVRSKAAFKHANVLGVKKKVFAAPADLLGSPYFEVVADYRKPGDLMRTWELFLMGDLFMERLDLGHEVTPGPIFTGIPLAVWMTQLLPSLIHSDMRLIPRGIGPQALGVMATTEKFIYKKAFKKFAKKHESRSLLDHAPWELRGGYEEFLDRDFEASGVFRITPTEEEKRKRRKHKRP